jgi:hypothetical protein
MSEEKQNTKNYSESSTSFAQFGKTFQQKVLQALLTDKIWATSFIEVFNVEECMDFAPVKILTQLYVNYFKRYKDFASIDLLKTIVKDEYPNVKDIVICEKMNNILQKFETDDNLSDLPWVKEKAFTFCRHQLLKSALLKSSEIIGTEKYETVIDLMKNAIASGMATNSGHDYNNDIDARYSIAARNPISTGLAQLDDKKIMNGGLGKGEVGIVVAPTGVGKSHILVHFGAQALLNRKNVFYYSMELNEFLIGTRFDSHYTGISSTDCPDNKDVIAKFMQENENRMGRLFIKQYPGRKITVNTIRAHIEKMSLKNIRPDLVIIDYAGIIRSTEKFELPRLEMQIIIQEIRSLGQELMIPVWTALQSNKEGAKADFVDVTNMAESYGQAAEADFVLGLQRKPEFKSTGYGNLFVAKSRLGIDGILFDIHLDTACSRLKFLTESEKQQLVEDQEEQNNEREEQFKKDSLAAFRKSIAKRQAILK